MKEETKLAKFLTTRVMWVIKVKTKTMMILILKRRTIRLKFLTMVIKMKVKTDQ